MASCMQLDPMLQRRRAVQEPHPPSSHATPCRAGRGGGAKLLLGGVMKCNRPAPCRLRGQKPLVEMVYIQLSAGGNAGVSSFTSLISGRAGRAPCPAAVREGALHGAPRQGFRWGMYVDMPTRRCNASAVRVVGCVQWSHHINGGNAFEKRMPWWESTTENLNISHEGHAGGVLGPSQRNAPLAHRRCADEVQSRACANRGASSSAGGRTRRAPRGPAAHAAIDECSEPRG